MHYLYTLFLLFSILWVYLSCSVNPFYASSLLLCILINQNNSITLFHFLLPSPSSFNLYLPTHPFFIILLLSLPCTQSSLSLSLPLLSGHPSSFSPLDSMYPFPFLSIFLYPLFSSSLPTSLYPSSPFSWFVSLLRSLYFFPPFLPLPCLLFVFTSIPCFS